MSKTVSGVGGVRAICEEQQNKKGIYPFHNKYLLPHNTVTLVLFFLMSHPPVKGEVYDKINRCLSSSSVNKMCFILTPALLP